MNIIPKTDYAKEEAVIVEKAGTKEETWAVGDKCRINSFYLQNYSGMNDLAEVDAVVQKVMVRQVRFEKGKEDPMFVNKYGKRDVYDLICLWVKYPDLNGVFLVSPFGYDKV
jgi:hypothetical protein